MKEVLLRDVQLPAEYAKSLEGLLLKEQENDRLSVELEVKAKEVKQAELEAMAEEARQVKQAEGQAQVTVLQAKAQADTAMQHTLAAEGEADPAVQAGSRSPQGSHREERGSAGRSEGHRQQG